jgi:hypothetical protein
MPVQTPQMEYGVNPNFERLNKCPYGSTLWENGSNYY